MTTKELISFSNELRRNQEYSFIARELERLELVELVDLFVFANEGLPFLAKSKISRMVSNWTYERYGYYSALRAFNYGYDLRAINEIFLSGDADKKKVLVEETHAWIESMPYELMPIMIDTMLAFLDKERYVFMCEESKEFLIDILSKRVKYFKEKRKKEIGI